MGASLAESFRAHGAYVWHTLRRLGVRAADLEDATHDVFLVVHKRWHEYDPARPIKPWLYGIATRVAMRHRSRTSTRREVPSELHEHAPAEERSPEAQVEDARRRAWVVAALAKVADSRRDVLILHDLDGVAMPDIAHALGIPLNTGYSRLRLARQDFQVALQRLRSAGEEP